MFDRRDSDWLISHTWKSPKAWKLWWPSARHRGAGKIRGQGKRANVHRRATSLIFMRKFKRGIELRNSRFPCFLEISDWYLSYTCLKLVKTRLRSRRIAIRLQYVKRVGSQNAVNTRINTCIGNVLDIYALTSVRTIYVCANIRQIL